MALPPTLTHGDGATVSRLHRALRRIAGFALMGASLLLVAAGVAAGVFFGTDGRYDGRSGAITKLARSVVIPTDSLEAPLPSLLSADTIDVVVSPADSARGVFAGIGPADEVERYLAGSAQADATQVSISPFAIETRIVPGDALPAPAAEQRFWVARAAGSGAQTLTWDPTPGTYRLVVLHSDSASPVAATLQVRLEIPWIFPAALVVMIGGLALFFVALTYLSSTPGPSASKPATRPRGAPPPPPLPKPLGGSAGPVP